MDMPVHTSACLCVPQSFSVHNKQVDLDQLLKNDQNELLIDQVLHICADRFRSKVKYR